MTNTVSDYLHGLKRRVKGQKQVWRDGLGRDDLVAFVGNVPLESTFDRWWIEKAVDTEDYTVLNDYNQGGITPYPTAVEEQSVTPVRYGMSPSEAVADLHALEEKAVWGLRSATAALYLSGEDLYVEAATRCSLVPDIEADMAQYTLKGVVGGSSDEEVETVRTALDTGDMAVLA